MTREAFDNAIRVAMAMGGSTNAMIHVIAMARRAGRRSGSTISTSGRRIPVLANVRPAATVPDGGFLLCRRDPGPDGAARGRARPGRLTVNGRTIGENIAGAEVYNDEVIRTLDNPVYRRARSPCSRQPRAGRLR